MTSGTASVATDAETDRLVQEVLEAGRGGNHARAAEIATAALDRGVQHALLFRVRAAWHVRHGRFQDALGDLETLRGRVRDDPILLDMIGHCLTRLNRPREAVAAFDRALAAAPGFAEAHSHKAIALGMLNELDAMQRSYEQVIVLNPGHMEALAGLAFLAARAGDFPAARSYGARALAREPRPVLALVALAMADIGDEAYDNARRTLREVLDLRAVENDGRLNMALGFAADAWDRKGQVSDAFGLYSALNKRRRDHLAARFEEARAIDDAQRQIAYFQRTAAWPASSGELQGTDGPASHVFLLGFVRSGTTLLETVLASHPDIVAIDEQDFLADAGHDYLRTDKDLDRLMGARNADLDRWRKTYWQGVREAGAAVAGKVFVDKVPFNSLRLPLIARLFPSAHIILAIRDPRDVVFSSFRHRFNPYPASYEFLQLDDCARYYNAVMTLVAECRDKLQLDLLEHRYEDMLAEFEPAVRRICGFIGIEWNDAMREFSAASGIVDPRSQSAAQVSRGLYQGGAGQWRRYREQLAPILPILQPWVERFGYTSN